MLILPLIVATFIAFQNQTLSLPVKKLVWLLWGAGTYVALNLFVYDFKNVYVFGKSWIDKWLTFFKPAGYVVPVYSIVLIVVYVVASLLGKVVPLQPYLLFAIAYLLKTFETPPRIPHSINKIISMSVSNSSSTCVSFREAHHARPGIIKLNF